MPGPHGGNTKARDWVGTCKGAPYRSRRPFRSGYENYFESLTATHLMIGNLKIGLVLHHHVGIALQSIGQLTILSVTAAQRG